MPDLRDAEIVRALKSLRPMAWSKVLELFDRFSAKGFTTGIGVGWEDDAASAILYLKDELLGRRTPAQLFVGGKMLLTYVLNGMLLINFRLDRSSGKSTEELVAAFRDTVFDCFRSMGDLQYYWNGDPHYPILLILTDECAMRVFHGAWMGNELAVYGVRDQCDCPACKAEKAASGRANLPVDATQSEKARVFEELLGGGLKDIVAGKCKTCTKDCPLAGTSEEFPSGKCSTTVH